MMNKEPTTIHEYIEAFSDFREGLREDEPSAAGLSEEDRKVVLAWTSHVDALAGIDSMPSLPSAASLLDRASVVREDIRWREIADEVAEHLHRFISADARVTLNTARSEHGAPWDLLASVHGLPLRVILDTEGGALVDVFDRRIGDIALILAAFPAEPSVVLAGINGTDVAATVTRLDIRDAYELPSGRQRPPRLFGPVESLVNIVQRYYVDTILEFDAPPARLASHTRDLVHVVEPLVLASNAVRGISVAGRRAQIEEKSAGYGLVGEPHETELAALIEVAMERPLDDYDVRLAALGNAA